MIKRILTLAAAFAAMAAAAGVCVVALAYALYAVAREYMTPAGASAVVAGVAALLIVLLAVFVLRKSAPKEMRKAAGSEEPTLTTRLVELARERPVVAGIGAVAAALVIARNPRIVTTIISAAVAGRAARAPDPRKR
ncbi:hypothetical protein [Phenylobacterium sp.]|uniref:hypothetical protein n=1 Tax=Phenylobacterium sp. TaxID=1871053 RepID=UPI002F9251B2